MRSRSLLLIAIFLFSAGLISAQNWIAITSDSPVPAATNLVATDASVTVVEFNLQGFYLNPVSTSGGEAFTINVDGATSMLQQGMPDLPKLSAALIIPDQAQMSARVISSRYIDYPFMDVAPSKGNFTRDIDPASIPYVYGKAYDRDEFFPANQVGLSDPYILRDFRGQTLIANPFSYNPVTKTLRVYYEMTVEVYADGISSYNILNRQSQPEKTDSEFQNVYARHFLNATSSSRYTPLEEQGNMLIISYGTFIPELEAFKAWKTTIGMPVEIVDVATIGATATLIKTFVADYYNTNGLTYLLLVGDNAQIPTVTTGGVGGPSDHAYAYVLGNDHYPEFFVGRFSAENVDQVQTQVTRTITYEQNPDVSVDWFSKGVGIASSQGPGDDGEYDYEHMNNIKSDLVGFTYTYVAELYDGSQGGIDLPGNPNSTLVANELNVGASIINYTGHGSQTSWGSSGFSNTGVNSLTNNNMWPFIFSVACVNGDFQNSTCFAEAWLRATNANGPTGAIATLMSTINQSWNPPMDGQDEMNDILVESYENNIKRTFGGIAMNGCIKMNETYGGDGEEMADTWLIFGDPSVMVRTAMPEELVVGHNPEAFIGSSQFEISCDVEHAFACLTLDGEILGTAFVDGGTAVIEIPTLSNVGTMKLAVTAFNHIPYIVDVDVFPLDGPYVVYNSQMINDADGNNNQQLDYDESVLLSLAFKNVGTEDVENVEVTLSTENPSVTITDNTESYPFLGAGLTDTITDGFAFSIGNDLPDGQKISFNYVAVAGDDEWSGSFNVTAHSAVLDFGGSVLTDENGNNNGKADPGETFDLHISILNEGGAPAYNLSGVLSTTDENISISLDSINYATIGGNDTLVGVYTVTANPATPSGHVAEFQFNISADGGFASTGSFEIVIGQIPVLIIDLDGNHNSGTVIQSSLNNLSVSSDYVTSWPATIDTYQSVFVCLGVYPNNEVLSGTQGQALADFLNNGGRVYMEGGDTWSFNTATAVHPMFMITGLVDGSGDLQTLNGTDGEFTEGMAFAFGGDNSYIDRLSPKLNAVSIFKNSSPVYDATIYFEGSNYKTIGSSFEFGGLTDADLRSVKDSLMLAYINFFELSTAAPLLANFIASDVEVCENDIITFNDNSAGEVTAWAWSFPGGVPDTSNVQNPEISYPEPGTYDVTLTVTDGVNMNMVTKTGYIIVDYCMGLNDLSLRNQVKVYPNPGNGRFTVELPELTGETALKVVSVSGVEVLNTTTSKSGIHNLQLPDASRGVYILLIDNAQMSKRIKLIIGQ
ncbi:MAG: C25 family cysteine peptidase [Lentimicrobium sp.]|jgi:PKD repeat protein|nr:C25 family cysteine peptidase [Lentimicrobium sp.]